MDGGEASAAIRRPDDRGAPATVTRDGSEQPVVALADGGERHRLKAGWYGTPDQGRIRAAPAGGEDDDQDGAKKRLCDTDAVHPRQ